MPPPSRGRNFLGTLSICASIVDAARGTSEPWRYGIIHANNAYLKEMCMKMTNQKGFSVIETLLILGIVGVLGLVG
jgi:hypothetical protein